MERNFAYKLSNGIKIPVIGFGTWQTPDGKDAYDSVMWALKYGYRHIDTAAIYGNEISVGQAIRDGMKMFGLKRSDLFITTKLWNGQRGSFDDSKRALKDSLTRLGLDYVDLYLIHWPIPAEFKDRDWKQLNKDSWRAMEMAYDEGKVKAIGVSNFQKEHLTHLIQNARIKPMVNQLFINPGDPQEAMKLFDDRHHIITEAYSPLGTGELLNDPVLLDIAKKLNKSPAQILLRWSIQSGYVPLPKSVHENRIRENIDIFDFSLSDGDMHFLNSMQLNHAKHQEPETITYCNRMKFID